MKIITTENVQDKAKTYFDLAGNKRSFAKKGKNKHVNLILGENLDEEMYVSDNWVKEYYAIPEEYRCNPFAISPSGDLFWADKRNVKQLDEFDEEIRTGKVTRVNPKDFKNILGLE
jgi:hypothetical protein